MLATQSLANSRHTTGRLACSAVQAWEGFFSGSELIQALYGWQRKDKGKVIQPNLWVIQIQLSGPMILYPCISRVPCIFQCVSHWYKHSILGLSCQPKHLLSTHAFRILCLPSRNKCCRPLSLEKHQHKYIVFETKLLLQLLSAKNIKT